MEWNLFKCIQGSVRLQYVEGHTKEGLNLEFLLGNEKDQVIEMSVRDDFGTSKKQFLPVFKVMEKD